MRQHTTEGDGRPNQGIQFLITTDGELQVTGGDTLYFEIFRGVPGKLENFRGEVFEDGGDVDGSWKQVIVSLWFSRAETR